MDTTVWAFQPLKELNGQTGFVACDSELAEKLIKAGKAQNPQDGAGALREITTVPHVEPEPERAQEPSPAEYADKEMTPKRRK